MAVEFEDQEEHGETSSTSSDHIQLETPLLNNTDDHEHDNDNITAATTTTTINAKKSPLTKLINIYADQSGSWSNITTGLSIIFISGAVTGILMPKDPDLTPVYRYVSSAIGYIYFVSWSVSFYPQFITNYRNKRIEGLSTDASILAITNFTCYAIYNGFFFWDGGIREEYKERHNANVTVQSNDVVFSIHALVITLLLFCQIVYYGGFRAQPITNLTKAIVLVVICLSMGYIACIHLFGFLWIDFLYFMASIKIVLTLLTYLPQLILNHQRKSTDGFNMWNVNLDCCGGLFSLLQLVLDSADLNDLERGCEGNWAKFLLGLLTLGFDTAFFLQFYYYGKKNDVGSAVSGSGVGNEDEDADGAAYRLLDNDDIGTGTAEDCSEHTEFV